MKQKRNFCKRLLTFVLCLAMVLTSVNVPANTLTAKAASFGVDVSVSGSVISITPGSSGYIGYNIYIDDELVQQNAEVKNYTFTQEKVGDHTVKVVPVTDDGENKEDVFETTVTTSDPSTTAPSAPDGLVVNDAGGGSINLAWAEDTSVNHYVVEVDGQRIDDSNARIGRNDGTIPGFASGTYKIGLIAVSSYGLESKASTKNVTVNNGLPDGEATYKPSEGGNEGGETGGNEGGDKPTEVPAKPFGLVFDYAGDYSTIILTWGTPAPAPDGWKVYIDDKLVGTTQSAGGNSYENIYLAGTHTVKIVAYNSAGDSEPLEDTFTLTEEQAGIKSDTVATEEQKKELQALYDSEKEIVDAGNTEDYTADSWNAYKEAVEAAKIVLDNDEATIKEVQDALKALQAAKDGLAKEGKGTSTDFASMDAAGNIELFVGGYDNWGSSAADYTVDGTSITVDCKNIGDAWSEWQIQLKLLGKILKANETYQISFKIVSDADKQVYLKVGDNDNDDTVLAEKSISLAANTAQPISVTTKATTEDFSSMILFALGQYGSDAPNAAAKITISDLKVYSEISGDAEGGGVEPATEADREKLQALYDKEKPFYEDEDNANKYTKNTWDNYCSAFEAVGSVLEQMKDNVASVTKQQADKAYDALTAARQTLKEDSAKISKVIISEQEQQAFAGNDVTLKYVANKEVSFNGYTVTVNGNPIDNSKVTINTASSTIKIAGDVFKTAGVYTIQFAMKGWTFSPVYQTVYATGSPVWNLNWNDEFDGDSLNKKNWDYQTGNGNEYGVSGWGNDEAERYTSSSDNSSVGDGTFTITAKQEADGTYTSARIRTVTEDIQNGKANLGTPLKIGTYGKVEAKIKMPAGNGIWPAFWMLPYDSEYGTWAASGELDIMEARGRMPNTVCGTIHYGGVAPENVYTGNDFYFPSGQDFTDYHIYGVEWDPDEIRWYVDGKVYSTLSDWYSIAGEDGDWPYPAPFDEEFYIILNLAVGGTFDSGTKEIAVDEDGVDMDVDYVRWYQRDQSVYENWDIEGPHVEAEGNYDIVAQLLAMADKNGNFIKDSNFKKMDTTPITTGDGWTVGEYGKWFPLLIPDNGKGQATWNNKVDNNGTNYLQVSVTDPGSQTYSVQMLQYFPLIKGYTYEISYDAYTDAKNRKADVSLKIGGDDDNGWSAYSRSYKDKLSTTPTTYTHQFIMSSATDPTARFEFNLATSDGNVYLSNVCVKILQEGLDESKNEDDPKNPKSDGNHIYNGDFSIGSDRLLYWHWSDDDAKEVVKSAKVEDGRVADITVGNSPVSIWQYGINLLQTDEYKLTFKVNTTAAQNVKITMSNKDGSDIYAEGTKALTAGDNTVEYTFTQPKDKTDVAAKLTLTFEKSVKLSSVKLIRTTSNNINWDEIDFYPMYNGDFSNGTDGWNIWSENAGYEQHSVNADGALDMDVSVGAGADFWCVGVQSKAMPLAEDMKWRVKFDYKLPSAKNYILELAGEQRQIRLEAGEHTYVSEPFNGTGTSKFTLYLGPDQTATYKFILDNVVVYLDESIDAPAHKQPVKLSQDGKGKAGSSVVVKYTEDADWGNAEKTYYLNGEEIEKVTENKADRTLTIDGSCFPEEGIYQFAVKAEEYMRTAPIDLMILDKYGNLLRNGSFSLGDTAWEIYDEDSGLSQGKIENGNYTLDYTKGYYRADWNCWVTWSSQLIQRNISIKAGTTYNLSFEATTTLDEGRDILIEVAVPGGNEDRKLGSYECHINKGTNICNVPIPVNETTDECIIKLLLGPVGDNLQLDMSDAEKNKVPHTLILDNISLLENGQVNKSILGNLLKDYAEAKEDPDFSSIYTAAEAVYNNDSATQDDINKAVEELRAGYLVIATAELTAVLEKYKDVPGDESNKIYQAFKKAYEAAEAMKDQDDVTPALVANAIKKLENAYDVLLKADELKKLIAEYGNLEQGNYTDYSWKEFTDALKAAQDTLQNEDVTLDMINEALEDLVDAYDGLTDRSLVVTDDLIKGDKTELRDVLNKLRDAASDENNENEAYKKFKKAYEDAKKVDANPNASKAQVSAAINAVKTNYLAYVKAVLQTDVDAYENMVAQGQSAYTEKTWEEFKKALDTAKKLLETNFGEKDALDVAAEIVEATEALEAANRALKREGLWIKAIPDQTYTGSALKPSVEVWEGDDILTEKKDYTVSYKNNTKAGTAQVIVKGKGNYNKQDTAEFTILQKDIGTLDVADVYAIINSKGKVTNPKVTIKYGKKTVTSGNNKDCTITWPEIPTVDGKTQPGVYSITIEAKHKKVLDEAGNETGDVTYTGNYKGKKTINYTVLSSDTRLMSKATIKLSVNKVTYAEANAVEPVRPSVTVTYGSGKNKETLVEGIDYVLEYPDKDGKEVEVGKAAVVVRAITKNPAEGNEDTRYYYGTKTATYTVTGDQFKTSNIKIEGFVNTVYTYSGKDIEPDKDQQLVLKDNKRKGDNGDSYTLKQGEDYRISYSNNKNASKKAAIIFEGIGSYAGNKVITKNFTISPLSLKSLNEENNNSGLVWTCDSNAFYTKTGAVPGYDLTFNETPLINKTDYTVSYSNNKKIGNATITIKGKGNFIDTVKADYAVTKLTTEAINNGAVYAEAADIVVPAKSSKLKASLKVYEASTGKALKAGTDYESAFEYYVKNDEGESTVTDDNLIKDQQIFVRVKLKNNYSGDNADAPVMITTSFRLYDKKQKASSFQVVVDNNEGKGWSYTGQGITPDITVYANKTNKNAGQPLTGHRIGEEQAGDDYVYEYTNNVQKGTAKIVITATGNGYGGAKTVTFKIKNKEMSIQHTIQEWSQNIVNFFSNLF